MANRIAAFILVLLYNMCGTLGICSAYPGDLLYGDWVAFTTILTFPVTAISFGYRMIQSSPLYPVFIIQSVMLISSAFMVDQFVKKRDNE